MAKYNYQFEIDNLINAGRVPNQYSEFYRTSIKNGVDAFIDCRTRLDAALASLHSFDPKLAEHIRTKDM